MIKICYFFQKLLGGYKLIGKILIDKKNTKHKDNKTKKGKTNCEKKNVFDYIYILWTEF